MVPISYLKTQEGRVYLEKGEEGLRQKSRGKKKKAALKAWKERLGRRLRRSDMESEFVAVREECM